MTRSTRLALASGVLLAGTGATIVFQRPIEPPGMALEPIAPGLVYRAPPDEPVSAVHIADRQPPLVAPRLLGSIEPIPEEADWLRRPSVQFSPGHPPRPTARHPYGAIPYAVDFSSPADSDGFATDSANRWP